MRVTENPTDAELLNRMRAGDEEAFTAVYRRRHGAVYRFALHMCGSGPAAEDVTQEVFLALMREPHAYVADKGSLAAFLCGVARNFVLRRLERDRAESSLPESADFAGPDDVGAELLRSEDIARVRSAVLALPARYREVVVLCDLEELTYEDAAEALGCAVGTVRSRLHRARRLLVDKLGLGRKAGCLI